MKRPVVTDRGSATVELVLIAPVLVVLALFVVLAGRSGEALRQVQHAADHGAGRLHGLLSTIASPPVVMPPLRIYGPVVGRVVIRW